MPAPPGPGERQCAVMRRSRLGDIQARAGPPMADRRGAFDGIIAATTRQHSQRLLLPFRRGRYFSSAADLILLAAALPRIYRRLR